MGTLTAAELTQLRTDQEELMDLTATVFNPTYSSDGKGGKTQSWGSGTSMACRMAKPSHDEVVVAGQYAGRIKWSFTFPYNATVRVDAKIQVGTRVFYVIGGGAVGSEITALRVTAVEEVTL